MVRRLEVLEVLVLEEEEVLWLVHRPQPQATVVIPQMHWQRG